MSVSNSLIIKQHARGLTEHLLSQMLDAAFASIYDDSSENDSFAQEISRSFLAKELAKSMAKQGINANIEKEISGMIGVQESKNEI
jgi:hypothetical protein